MKKQVVKRMKKVLATVLAVSMLAGLGMVASARIYPESEVTGVSYEERTDYETYLTNQTAPAGSNVANSGRGTLFAGWYASSDKATYSPLQSLQEANGAVSKGQQIYAKFIPANLLSVKCQALADTSLESPQTSLKIFAGLDSLNYKEVGFKVYGVTLSEDGKTLVKDNFSGEAKATTVYNTLKVKVDGEESTLNATDAFGAGIGAKYFATTWLKDIVKDNYKKIISVKPYLITLDGTTVDGLEKYVHVEDAFEIAGEDGYRWVNIPINVRDTEAVAAGVLKLTNENGWNLAKVECGRLFEEMDYAIKESRNVKLVGNLSDMTGDAQNAENAIYANVRLKVYENEISDGNNHYDFSISEVDFANIDEEQFTATNGYDVWDIAYSIMK